MDCLFTRDTSPEARLAERNTDIVFIEIYWNLDFESFQIKEFIPRVHISVSFSGFNFWSCLVLSAIQRLPYV